MSDDRKRGRSIWDFAAESPITFFLCLFLALAAIVQVTESVTGRKGTNYLTQGLHAAGCSTHD